jgi:LPS export ABC transporter protein LptC
MEISSGRSLQVALLSAVLLLAACSMCSREEPGGKTVQQDKPLPDQVISDFSITETASGKKEWNMKARKAYIYDSRDVLEAEEMEVEFFDERGRVKSRLVANVGIINRATNDMEARGDVVVIGNSGVILETQTLQWLSKTRKIMSDDSVKVIREGDVLTGVGFRGDPDLGSFEILRDMKATIRASDGELGGGTDD